MSDKMRTTLALAVAILLASFFIPDASRAGTVNYELAIARDTISIAGAKSEGMTINGGIPGPILRFTEGDTARIVVHNRMNVPTSIHWHGVLVPPNMDGVPYVSFPPIQPGASFVYEFPIRQSGTYWYHSHSNLQEQSGVYGSIVILPRNQNRHGEEDHVVLLSDWTSEDPHEVLRTLKRGSEWFALEKGSSQSILGAARAGRLGEYAARELRRMPAMDIADVAYDYFLANGKPETAIPMENGGKTRLRIINGSATTYFHIEFAGGPMTVIAADGQNVEPFEQQRLLIGVAETYDVLVNIPHQGAYELRATAHDGSGHATVWLGDGERFGAPDVPKPDLYRGMDHGGSARIWALTPAGSMGMPDDMVESGMFDRPGMAGMETMNMEHGSAMGHDRPMKNAAPAMQEKDGPKRADAHGNEDRQGMSHGEPADGRTSHAMSVESKSEGGHRGGKRYADNFSLFASDVSSMANVAADGLDPRRPWPPYEKLRALKSTALDPGKPVRNIRLTLDGDMERYVWFLNNKPLSESDKILIREGEVVRFIMINRTMMHHPMHLHGHFFRVINGQGDHAPLKHTVDVAPMSTTVIEFDANEFGDWFFHCHLLYHMKSGMARVVHYDGFQPDDRVTAVQPALFDESWYAWADADVLSNMSEGLITLSDSRNIFAVTWEVGWEGVDETHWETIVSYDRYVNRFTRYFVGIDLLGEGSTTEETRGIAGLRYLLPLNVESTAWLDTDGGFRAMLEKEFMLTPRLSLITEVEYDTHDQWEGKTGLSYTLAKRVSVLTQWHSEFGWGVGVQIRF